MQSHADCCHMSGSNPAGGIAGDESSASGLHRSASWQGALEAEHAQQLFVEHDDACIEAWIVRNIAAQGHTAAACMHIDKKTSVPLIEHNHHATRPSFGAPILEKYLQRTEQLSGLISQASLVTITD